MPGILLDSHTLYWLVSGERTMSDEALAAISLNEARGSLSVSPITAWELALATQKARNDQRPDFGSRQPHQWFRQAVSVTGARLIPIAQRISNEAAKVVATTGHGDPGDCFLIATARVRHLAIVTRDGRMHDIAARHSGYLEVIPC